MIFCSDRMRRYWRQEQEFAQLVAAGPQPAPHKTYSPLATKLLLLFFSGENSATAIRELAHCAILDGAQHAELGIIASCGNWGLDPGNIHRDILTKFCKNVSLANPFLVDTNVLDSKTSQIETEQAAVFHPHMMLATMESYEEFDAVFTPDKLQAFWQGVVASGDPRLIHHPMVLIPNWQQLFVPVFIHGDGVEYAADSLLVYHWGNLLSTLGSVDGGMLLSAFPKKPTVKTTATMPGTWDPLLLEMLWSFTTAFHGVHPAALRSGAAFEARSKMAELAGKPLTTNGLRLVVWCLEGDHDFFSNVLRLPHWSNDDCCWACDCRTSDPLKTWQELRRAFQGWTCRTIQDARAMVPDFPFFQIPGVSTLTVGMDTMHILFCKGVLARLFGSVLHTMCYPDRGRQTVPPQQRIGLIFGRVQEIYDRSHPTTRLTNLKLKMFCDPAKPWVDYPFLNTKASEAKHLLPCLTLIAQEVSTGSEHDERRTAALFAIYHFVRVLDEADIFLTEGEAQAAVHYIEVFLGHYAWLHQWAQRPENDRYAYPIVIKFHMLQHVALCARYLNPRICWCFKAEDYVGRISTLAASVSGGNKASVVSRKLADKWRLLLHIRHKRGDFSRT